MKKLLSKTVCSVVVILGIVFSQNNGLKTSTRGLEHIANLEGCRNSAYQCSAGTWTSGIGHTSGVNAGYFIDNNQIAENFIYDVSHAERVVNKFLNANVTQSQFDVMVSFVFNLGQGNFQRSTMLKKFNNNNPTSACNEFMRWVYVNGKNCHDKKNNCSGIVERRIIEKNACLNGW